MGTLEGKIALITNGNSPTSLATAKLFMNEGAYVFLVANRDSTLVATVKEIGKTVRVLQRDISDRRDLSRLFAQIKREKSRLDIVVANVAAAEYAPFGEITVEHYDSIINLHVKGVFYAVENALPLLRGGASIVVNSAFIVGAGSPVNSVYGATKAVALSFARTWTMQLMDRWIRVNAVSSGSAHTKEPEQKVKSLSRSIPVTRLSRPDEIANAVVSLLGDENSDLTGAELTVEGEKPELKMLPTHPPPARLASADEIAKAIVFLASPDSRGITGMELFVDGGMTPL
jgi:NAD(P)-dependent dehydrogenase (short-subunit alcohol dehydrogenase family)